MSVHGVESAPPSTEPTQEAFIPSAKFTGKKDGYYFGAGKNGVGYYLDAAQSSKSDGSEGKVDAKASAKKAIEKPEAVEKAKNMNKFQGG